MLKIEKKSLCNAEFCIQSIPLNTTTPNWYVIIYYWHFGCVTYDRQPYNLEQYNNYLGISRLWLSLIFFKSCHLLGELITWIIYFSTCVSLVQTVRDKCAKCEPDPFMCDVCS